MEQGIRVGETEAREFREALGEVDVMRVPALLRADDVRVLRAYDLQTEVFSRVPAVARLIIRLNVHPDVAAKYLQFSHGIPHPVLTIRLLLLTTVRGSGLAGVLVVDCRQDSVSASDVHGKWLDGFMVGWFKKGFHGGQYVSCVSGHFFSINPEARTYP